MELLIDEIRFKRILADQVLKIEFVNDVPFYLGELQKIPKFPFSAIDNLQNILSNKITALRDRNEIKDLADIREIAGRFEICGYFSTTDRRKDGKLRPGKPGEDQLDHQA